MRKNPNEEQRERKRVKNRDWLSANKDRVATRMKVYLAIPHVKEKRALRSREHRARNPEKYRARYLVSNAIESGRLVPQPCEKCGAPPPTHGHHEDYTKPLDVVWLCRLCHVDRHKELRNVNT